MKSSELQPTTENLIESLKQDSCGRNKDIAAFIKILDSIEGNASIALNGLWGSGKTFFVKQTKLIIEHLNIYLNDEIKQQDDYKKIDDIIKNDFNKINNTPLLPVYFDAWANDNEEDPITTLLYEINKQLATTYNFYKKDYGVIYIDILGLVFSKNGKDLYRDLKGQDLFEKQIKEKDLRLTVNNYFDTVIQEKANKLVIFIDELDRCKPTYAVKFLERIKHYFDNENVVFVFSINKIELEHTISNCYGERFDTTRYLDRFFTWSFDLPKENLNSFYKTINFINTDNFKDILSDKVRNHFNLTLREIPKFLEAINHVYNDKHLFFNYIYDSRPYTSNFIKLFVIPYMIGLKMTNTNHYNDFLSGHSGNDFMNFYLKDIELVGILHRVLDIAQDVDMKPIIQKSYEALFIHQFVDDLDQIQIENKMVFNSYIQADLEEVMSLFIKIL